KLRGSSFLGSVCRVAQVDEVVEEVAQGEVEGRPQTSERVLAAPPARTSRRGPPCDRERRRPTDGARARRRGPRPSFLDRRVRRKGKSLRERGNLHFHEAYSLGRVRRPDTRLIGRGRDWVRVLVVRGPVVVVGVVQVAASRPSQRTAHGFGCYWARRPPRLGPMMSRRRLVEADRAYRGGSVARRRLAAGRARGRRLGEGFGARRQRACRRRVDAAQRLTHQRLARRELHRLILVVLVAEIAVRDLLRRPEGSGRWEALLFCRGGCHQLYWCWWRWCWHLFLRLWGRFFPPQDHYRCVRRPTTRSGCRWMRFWLPFADRCGFGLPLQAFLW
ncbi:unnamed protein product, partial [Pelagomonas calceolata]